MYGGERMRCSEIVDILEIMRLSEMGLSQRQIATSLNCGKTTVGDVNKRCRGAGLTYATASVMTKAEIKGLLYPAKRTDPEKEQPDWEAVHSWLKGGKRRNLQYALE
jgi:transposase